MSRDLTKQEMHNLAMNLVGHELEEQGYEFLAVNSKLKKDPQFVCIKDSHMFFVLVRGIPFPEDPLNFDKELVTKMKDHAIKFKAETFYAGVGLSNADDRNLPLQLNEPYTVTYHGLQKV